MQEGPLRTISELTVQTARKHLDNKSSENPGTGPLSVSRIGGAIEGKFDSPKIEKSE